MYNITYLGRISRCTEIYINVHVWIFWHYEFSFVSWAVGKQPFLRKHCRMLARAHKKGRLNYVTTPCYRCSRVHALDVINSNFRYCKYLLQRTSMTIRIHCHHHCPSRNSQSYRPRQNPLQCHIENLDHRFSCCALQMTPPWSLSFASRPPRQPTTRQEAKLEFNGRLANQCHQWKHFNFHPGIVTWSKLCRC